MLYTAFPSWAEEETQFAAACFASGSVTTHDHRYIKNSLICSHGDRFTTRVAALLSSRPFTIQVIILMTGVMPSLLQGII